MIDVRRQQDSKAETDSIGFAFNTTLIKEAELWMRAHRDFLASVESMMTDWLRRQRAAFDASNRSVRKICDSRNIIVVKYGLGPIITTTTLIAVGAWFLTRCGMQVTCRLVPIGKILTPVPAPGRAGRPGGDAGTHVVF